MFLNYDNYQGGEHNIYTQIYQALVNIRTSICIMTGSEQLEMN